VARKQCKHFDTCGNYVGGNSRHLECSKCATIRKRYGITLEERNGMMEEQSSCCAICDREVQFYNTAKDNPLGLERAVVDHNHDTGDVRAILCHSCNTALGLLGEDPNRLMRMYSYIREFN
jgi:hypothetical protein